jgi:hypothetical protein
MTRGATLAALLCTALLFTSAACIPEEGPMMEPGSNCMECHDGGEGRKWTVAGTWSGQGRQVVIVDAAGKTFTLHTNQAGNFWSSEPISYPLRVSVDGSAMPSAVTSGGGSCNTCHGFGGGGGGD